MTDALGSLINVLLAESSVTALIGTRIFGSQMPASESQLQPRKALLLRYAGGGGGEFGSRDFTELGMSRIDFFFYGENHYESDRVRLAVHPILKATSRRKEGTTLIHDLVWVGGPIAFTDPDTEWPILMETWEMLASEFSVV